MWSASRVEGMEGIEGELHPTTVRAACEADIHMDDSFD